MDYQELLTNEPPLPIPKHHQFRKAWRWPHCIEDFFKLRIEGKHSLHVCCGQSSLGNVRIDIDPQSKRTHEGDMNNIPFENCSFDIVFGDWPWKLNFFQRWKPFYEMIRKCKVGGYVIINCTWVPFSNSVILKEMFVRSDFPFGQASLILVYEKITSEFD